MKSGSTLAVVAALLCLLGGPASAEFTLRSQDDPKWLKKPDEEDLLRVWPVDAANRGDSGAATIECGADARGVLGPCKVISETGSGFGSAALLLTPQYLLKAPMVDGQPRPSTVRLTIRFIWPEGKHGVGTRSRASMEPDLGMTTTVIQPPRDWKSAPSYSEVVAAYPARARAAQVGGHVILFCRLDRSGGLSPCETTIEEPHGQGFALAAKELAKSFKVGSVVMNGRDMTGAKMQLPVTFAVEMLNPEATATGKPSWTALPNAAAVHGAFPVQARQTGTKSGKATLTCKVVAEGALDCALASEEPAGQGFGAAALELSPYFRLSTWTPEGLPMIGGKVRFPIRFEAEESAPDAQ